MQILTRRKKTWLRSKVVGIRGSAHVDYGKLEGVLITWNSVRFSLNTSDDRSAETLDMKKYYSSIKTNDPLSISNNLFSFS